MAEVGRGLEWSIVIKPLLDASYSSFNKNDIPDLVKAILKSEKEILQHDDIYEPFYSSFVALASHFLGASTSNLSKSYISQTTAACKVVMEFLLERLKTTNESCTISEKYLIVLIKGFCKGSGCLPKCDVVTFTSMLKSAKSPPPIQITEDSDEQETKDGSKPRLGKGTNLFNQLTSVFDEISAISHKPDPPVEVVNVDGNTIIHLPDSSEEISLLVGQRNKQALLQLNGAEILLDACVNLTFLGKYIQRYKDACSGKTFSMPTTLGEALTTRNSYQCLVNDVSVVWRAFSLPIIEPLTAERLGKIVDVTLGCLYASMTVAISNTINNMVKPVANQPAASRDEEIEGAGISIVQRTLEILSSVSSAVKNSTRAGGNVAQNINLLAVYVLLKGFQNMLSLTPAIILERKDSARGKTQDGNQKAKETSTPSRPSSGKSTFQGFGVVSVALGSTTATLLTSLLEDLQVEGSPGPLEMTSKGVKTTMDMYSCITMPLTAWKRVRKLTSTINIIDLLFSLVAVSLKKATLLKRLKHGSDNSETSSSSTSDSNTFFEDEFSSEEDSSDDDEQDSMLGQLFQENVSSDNATATTPPPLPPRVDSGSDSKRSRRVSTGDSSFLIPDKREPDGFVSLATSILNFSNTYMINSSDEQVRKLFKKSLNEEHASSLAILIKELDKECTKSGSDKVFDGISVALAKFNHSLIATECMSENLQDVLLIQLGISPSSVDPWPLTVYPRTLAVLAEILLLKQQKEREIKAVTTNSDRAVIEVWTRFLSTLKNAISNFDNKSEQFDDLNVEHIQLLLFLFHSLPLMQKKQLLLNIAQTVISVAEKDKRRLEETVPLPLSRMMLIFEYMLHYFYEAPSSLMEQVQWNLFTVHTIPPGCDRDGSNSSKATQFFPCKEVEENFRKNLTQELSDVGVLKPRFYNLGPGDLNNQEAPKIDGFACSFLLSNPDVLDYNRLYDACITLLLAGSRCDKMKDKLTFLDGSAMHYHFLLMWRLLACLPPSVSYLKLLQDGSLNLGNGHILHNLRWAPRLGVKNFTDWITDCVVKQGCTTAQADGIVSGANKSSNSINYDVRLGMNFIKDQLKQLPEVDKKDVLPPNKLPSLSSILMLDAIIAKMQVALDITFSKSESDLHKAIDIAQDLIPATFKLIEAYYVYVRSCVLDEIAKVDAANLTPLKLNAFGTVMSIGSSRNSKVLSLGSTIMALLPSPVRTTVEKWNNNSGNDFPAMQAWRNTVSDILPCESYMDAIHSAHMVSLSGQSSFCINASIRHLLQSLVRFANDLVVWCPDSASSKELVRVMFPLLYDVTTEYLAEMVSFSLEKFLGLVEEEKFGLKMYEHVTSVCHDLIENYSDVESGLDESILYECLSFMENHIEKSPGKKAIERCYSSKSDLTTVFLTIARDNLSPKFATEVLKFFNKLYKLAERNPNDKSYSALCCCLSDLATADPLVLQTVLKKLFTNPTTEGNEEEKVVKENRQLLQSLASYLVKDRRSTSEAVADALLNAMFPLCEPLLTQPDTMMTFTGVMTVMHTLAGAGQGRGHIKLFKEATKWLDICKVYLSKKGILEKVLKNDTAEQGILDTLCCILSYVGNILSALKRSSDGFRIGATTPPLDTDQILLQDRDNDWDDDLTPDDNESAGEDSDEETLNNKLCTFTVTQKEFRNQHWYHCHTCKMVDGVGVCTICAHVCHKDHDLSYAKFGSFFCDCGAKEDGSCKALVKRTHQSGLDSSGTVAAQSPFSMETLHPSSLRRRLSSPNPDCKSDESKSVEEANKTREALCQQIDSFRDEFLSHMESSSTVHVVLEMLEKILPPLTENYQEVSPIGSTVRAQKALQNLHSIANKTAISTEQLMTVTLGSQEGAFENVRMNYSGDQGQTIRQLITAHMLRRVAMCVLSSPHGKRQHLAVSHEKGKITILQLSALLKQADSSKKKLTLTRLYSAPIPFTVLSITGNPCNEDFLAVCGLKDCHVLTFTGVGTVGDHLVLHPSLATGNFIIKALWLPGSQTELAIVTADFVKIYDLAVDALSPQYYFLLPSGKVRDASFIFSEEGRYMVLMSSSGYIYTQIMEDTSSAVHGPFYITNVLEVKHPDLKEVVSNQVAGGGVSVYYSHTLQLLFFSYTQGKSFVAPVAKDFSQVINISPIPFKSSNGGGKGGNNHQPLVQWSEVPGHTGLMYCMAQTSNNPVVLMIKPDTISMQEIKVVPAKAKIQDVVAIRHIASNSDQQRTTMILLCEDGSLRIYMANVDNTNFWLSPYLQPQSPMAIIKPVKKKKVAKSGRPSGNINFPVDFFEHCQQSNDIEFGGNDVLQIYNVQQVKHRLNTTGMYIASTKPGGFTIEITNTNNANVMVGIRVLVGTQTAERTPSYIEVFGRNIPVNTTRSRWYDLPFTREESLTADKKINVTFGASIDPAGFTMVDSLKVYCKTKEVFGWPEEPDEFPEPSSGVKTPTTAITVTNPTTENLPAEPLPMTTADKLLGSALEVLDGAFATSKVPEEKDTSREKALEVASGLLTLPTPNTVQQHTKSLLSSLFSSKHNYHNHKDQVQLLHVMQKLSTEGVDMDVESFQRLVVTAQSVAVSRAGNLIKFAEKGDKMRSDGLEVTDLDNEKEEKQGRVMNIEQKEKHHFTTRLMEAFWKLHACKPANPMLAPVCLPGLAHIDATVSALVKIIHAFTMCDFDCLNLATKHYVKLLLSTDPVVSFACRQAMINALRPRHRRKRVFIPSPPRCSSAGDGGDDDEDDDDDSPGKGDAPDTPLTEQPELGHVEPPEGDPSEMYEVVDNNDEVQAEANENGAQGNAMPLQGAYDGLWGMDGNYAPMVEIPPDADDEAMVELAIALSLQDQSGNAPGELNLQALSLDSQVQSISSMELEEGPLSDTTASAPGSDDEIGSNAATDGSNLRTSPAEHGGSAGSESGGSAVDSISVSGRSSAYGYNTLTTGARSETSSIGAPSGSMHHEGELSEADTDYDTNCRLHALRLQLLERLLHYLPDIREIGGVRAIPFMQVVLMLTSDLDSEDDKDRAALDNLLTVVLKELDFSNQKGKDVSGRGERNEVKLILLRLLSVLLSRTRSGTKASNDATSFTSNCTATALLSSGAIDYCLAILTNLLPFWVTHTILEEDANPAPGQLLKPHPCSPPPDMSPFFLRQYVKGHANDVFEDYPQLLTEMVLRLPYQLKKISDTVQSVPNAVFDPSWNTVLSEYMMTNQTPFVKRQVRKLLLFICGSKDKYRQLRDQHAIGSHLKAVVEICEKGGLDTSADIIPRSVILPYDTLLTLIEHLRKVCSEIASNRAYNWQIYCEKEQDTVAFLVKASIALDEGVAPTLLQLLQLALCGSKASQVNPVVASSSTSTGSPVKHKSKDKDKDKHGDSEESSKYDENLCIKLVKLLNKVLDDKLFVKFVRTFLLESNQSSNRWLAHSLVLQLYRNSSLGVQETMLNLMWGLWSELPIYGRKSAQFVDLLGFFLLKTSEIAESKVQEYLMKATAVLKEENQILTNHPNAPIYNMLQGLVDFDGYYLESDPCLVCNNPEVAYSSLKLSAIKVDSKFTTTTQIVKLVGSHTISKISLRISDLKRTKMVRVMNIYYNNRTVQAVVELKNRPGLWHKARKVNLTTGQTDVKVEFPIPIVACNLMIEYADFYDNLQATSETLQCPRCSASVPANPGVCSNCGENVYQCHKCRAINYDEKDPFLCNACGFCKYAKFDFNLTAKPCCAVDPIETEEDRKKAITTINTLLEKADRIYKQLQSHRPVLENLLIQVTEHGSERLSEEGVGGSAGGAGVAASNVNKAIQMLAQKYCGECKSSFDELSKIIQKVMACRRELVEYDRQQREAVAAKGQAPGSSAKSKETQAQIVPKKILKEGPKSSNCYGCANAAVEHCITLLRALVTNGNMRDILCNQGMIQQLIDYNLRHGALPVRNEVRSLLCLLTKDDRRSTEEMNKLIMNRIKAAIRGHQSNPDLGSSVRHEILLLSTSLQQDDACWEQRVKCVMRLFLTGMHLHSPIIMDNITLPCLRILQGLVRQEPTPRKTKESGVESGTENLLPAKFHMDVRKWLSGDARYSYKSFRKNLPRKASVEEEKKAEEKKSVRARYLSEKYGTRWRQKMWKTPAIPLKLSQSTWLQQAMFSPSSRSARQTACSIIEAIAQVPSRRKEVIDMLSRYLDDVGKSGESSCEFLSLYKKLIAPDHWKYYLAIKGVLLHLGDLVAKEVEKILHLEDTTLSSDLAQGFALKSLTELMSLFVEQDSIKHYYKSKLVGFILNGYLSLRKLVVQRTKLIDETQEKLLELLEELTTGTECETKEFMSVCVKTVEKYPMDDGRSPVFIFERLCSIIYPEENDVGEFFVILEKDPQQEDFLQGRMLGNPYSTNEPGMGPLMRDIKNKICQDCELIALLDDDTGMELLVNKKIISLDLPVKEVYKKIWLPDHGEGEPMPIIYRMRGLLGDATEDMVNSLVSSSEDDVDKEEVFKMAGVLAECGGLRVMLERMASIKDLVLGKQLMDVLLKLFGYAVNVKANRQELIKTELDSINIMLGALNLALWSEQEGASAATKGQTTTEQILHIMEVILLEASQQPPEKYTEFSKQCGDKDQLMVLLDRINSSFVRNNINVLQALMRLIPFLAFGEEDKMTALLNHFKPYMRFNKFDIEHTQDEEVHLDSFCVIASGIQNNANGSRLKDMIIEQGIVLSCVEYILEHSPTIKTLLATDSEVWKEFLTKPALGYILRILAGLCPGHKPTQGLVAQKCIPVLHKMEQVSSDKHIGTLAENLLDALKENEDAAKKIEDIRTQTKAEKKRLAMAVRKKQLGALGMTTNEKGQVTVKSSVLKQMEDLKEETGLTCCICREGYRYQAQKVLAVYTYTKRCNLDEFENKSRKTVGYTTVSHFNVIHVDCHNAAVRHARGREEWESAALQNANTKCNGLLPMWGPQVQESVFASCLARHNNYLQECTGVRDPSYPFTVHDLKLLLLRFANEKLFSEDSGGGGRQSNMHLIPYMLHMALYVINSTRLTGREEKNVGNYLDMPKEKWVENSFEAEGPMYYPVLAMLVLSSDKWKENRTKFLDRLFILSHARNVCSIGAKSLPEGSKTLKDYSVYKPVLIFFGLVNTLFIKLFKKVTVGSDSSWSNSLADYLRHNDKAVLEMCDRVLATYQDEILPCESINEFLDVMEMLEDIADPEQHFTTLLSSLP